MSERDLTVAVCCAPCSGPRVAGAPDRAERGTRTLESMVRR